MRPREIPADELVGYDVFLREVAEPCRPVVIRGLVRAWPAVRQAAQSPAHFRDYLAQFDAGKLAEIFVGEPRIAGKYYYNEALTGFNFERERMSFGDALARIVSNAGRNGGRSMYLGSLTVDDYLPGFAAQNALSILRPLPPGRIWLGHESNVSAHYDSLDNLACVVTGKRRFTLFSPELTDRLYMGPIDFTMAGQPVSLAASAPDGEAKYPRFQGVREHALTAELDAGDAIYIPKLWWHQVEAISPFNALLNYWWDAFPTPDAPSVGLLLSLITISERPLAERQAWKAFFDHYVFRSGGHPLAHLPESQHGVLGPLQPDNYSRLRARVMQLLRGG
jgi:Cupin-like domain